MIRTRKELREYLAADMASYRRNCGIKGLLRHLTDSPISDQWFIWKYIKTMRYAEFYINKYKSYRTPFALYYLHRLRKYGRITGFQIHPNTCGKGLTIWHYGTIIINANARIGERCVLRPDILIGHKTPGSPAPVIGNDVEINSGVRIIGSVNIGDDVIIGVNTVVNKNIPSHSIVVGNPGVVIKTRGSLSEAWSPIDNTSRS